jgi:hypothetical protein
LVPGKKVNIESSGTSQLCHHGPVSRQLSVMKTPVALLPILKWMEQRMLGHRRFTQTASLEERGKGTDAVTQAGSSYPAGR